MDKQILTPQAITRLDHEGDTTSCVRVYKSSPDRITLQIRTHSRTALNKGKLRPAYSSVSLPMDQLKELIATLTEAREAIVALTIFE